MRSAVLLLCGLMLCSPAMAAEGSGEAVRLTEQLKGFIDRGAYPAADRTYRALAALPGAQLNTEDLFMGAEAARATGDMLACRERLLVAFQRSLLTSEGLDERARAWLAELQTRYGHVTVTSKGIGTLVADEAPFEPDRRAAIQFASEHIRVTGRFDGLLPDGGYSWGKSDFDVVAGTDPVKVKIKGPKK